MQYQSKIKSFTLPELLVVMIITVIVIGIAFSVLSLVQRQIESIKQNFSATTELTLLEQQLWQDFNSYNRVYIAENKLTFISDVDTTRYHFNQKYTLKNIDTLNVNVIIDRTYYLGKKVSAGQIDAVSLSSQKELPGYSIFAFKSNDATNFMND